MRTPVPKYTGVVVEDEPEDDEPEEDEPEEDEPEDDKSEYAYEPLPCQLQFELPDEVSPQLPVMFQTPAEPKAHDKWLEIALVSPPSSFQEPETVVLPLPE